jgi:hypothetical protein
MPDFNVRSDSVNVEQLMEQIRARIREKRGVDYTEEQIREIAAVRLERFLDPRGVRSGLLEEFQSTDADPNYAFEDSTLFDSSKAPVRWIRRLLRPILRLFFNPNPIFEALHLQAQLNARNATRNRLYYELLHNLVVEMTRLGIEVKNLKMRVESLSARVDFNERRARALESVVVYKPDDRDEGERASAAAPPEAEASGGAPAGEPGAPGPGQRSRRRRRRRGRRGGAPAASVFGQPAAGAEVGAAAPAAAPEAPPDREPSAPPAGGPASGGSDDGGDTGT